jgi:hypothetical protein
VSAASRALLYASLLALGGCPPDEPARDGGLDAAPAEAGAPDASRDDAAVSDAGLDAAPEDAGLDARSDDAPAFPDACPPLTSLCDGVCVDLEADPDHCGRCDHPCEALAGSIPFCSSSRCVNAVCRPGFGNCDGDRGNGCEEDTDRSLLHCGRCDHPCEGAPNASPTCTLGTCGLVCDPGFVDCDTTLPGCECSG